MRTAPFLVALLAITLLGGGLRMAVMEATRPVLLMGDEYYYLEVARSIAGGHGHHAKRIDAWAAWPPGQAFWLSRFLPVDEGLFPSPDTPRAALRGQVLLGTGIVALVGLLGTLLSDRRTGLVAAALAALLPELVAFSHYLYAANLFSLLLLGAWCAVVQTARGGSALGVAAAGVLFGLAALTRETALGGAIGSAAWLLWRAAPGARRRAAWQGAAMLLLCLLTVAPWTARNFERIGRLVPVSTVGWMALREGNTLHPTHWMLEDHEALAAFRRAWFALPEAERNGVARREALERIAAAQPAWLGIKLVRNLAWLTTPDSFLLHKLSQKAYGEVPLAGARTLLVLCVGLYLLVFVLGSIGLAAGRTAGAASFAVAGAGPLLALHVLANASPRYRIPLLPLLTIGSAVAIVQWRSLASRLRHPRAIPAAAILLFLFAVSVPRFAPDAVALWQRGTVFGP